MFRRISYIAIGLLICAALGFAVALHIMALNMNVGMVIDLTVFANRVFLLQGLWYTFFMANATYMLYMLLWDRSGVWSFFVWFLLFISSSCIGLFIWVFRGVPSAAVFILTFLVPLPLSLLALASAVMAVAGKEFIRGLLYLSQVFLFLTSYFFIFQTIILFFAS